MVLVFLLFYFFPWNLVLILILKLCFSGRTCVCLFQSPRGLLLPVIPPLSASFLLVFPAMPDSMDLGPSSQEAYPPSPAPHLSQPSPCCSLLSLTRWGCGSLTIRWTFLSSSPDAAARVVGAAEVLPARAPLPGFLRLLPFGVFQSGSFVLTQQHVLQAMWSAALLEIFIALRCSCWTRAKPECPESTLEREGSRACVHTSCVQLIFGDVCVSIWMKQELLPSFQNCTLCAFPSFPVGTTFFSHGH